MSQQSIAERVRAIVRNELGADTAEDSQDLREDLNADSLDAVELILEFEKEFSIEISDEEAEQIRTVGNAISLIETKVSQ